MLENAPAPDTRDTGVEAARAAVKAFLGKTRGLHGTRDEVASHWVAGNALISEFEAAIRAESAAEVAALRERLKDAEKAVASVSHRLSVERGELRIERDRLRDENERLRAALIRIETVAANRMKGPDGYYSIAAEASAALRPAPTEVRRTIGQAALDAYGQTKVDTPPAAYESTMVGWEMERDERR